MIKNLDYDTKRDIRNDPWRGTERWCRAWPAVPVAILWVWLERVRSLASKSAFLKVKTFNLAWFDANPILKSSTSLYSFIKYFNFEKLTFLIYFTQQNLTIYSKPLFLLGLEMCVFSLSVFKCFFRNSAHVRSWLLLYKVFFFQKIAFFMKYFLFW